MPLRNARMPRTYARHPRDMTPKQRLEWMRSMEGLEQLEYDLLDTMNTREMIPAEWFDIWEGEERDARRSKVTIRLDADVVRFFKTMGVPHEPRAQELYAGAAGADHRWAGDGAVRG